MSVLLTVCIVTHTFTDVIPCELVLYTHRSVTDPSDENRRIQVHRQRGPDSHGDHESPQEVFVKCVSCSQVSDGQHVCEKYFVTFQWTSDMSREMYKRFCRTM